MTQETIGTSVPRKEGWKKLTGEAVYIDDLRFDDMIYGATIRSRVARGKIQKVDFTGDIPWDEFTVVTADDIPGLNIVKLLVDDQPFLAKDRINHPDEPVVLIAHPNKHLVARAREHVEIVVEQEPGVFTIEDSLAQKQIVWGQDNILKTIVIEKGEVASVWDQADLIIEGTYTTGASEQLYIENNGMIAKYSPEEGVTVWGSMQCPYYVHPGLCSLFGLPKDKIRVIQTETGGGFGGKEEYPTLVAGHAALLAMKSGRPVKLVYDREEDMAATTKRHPSRTHHKTALTKDGKLLAMEVDFVLDGGAYVTLSPVVLSRGSIHAAGPYRCDHVRIHGRAVATNTPPHGAYRGFGNPQCFFAVERHMDKIARELGLPPEELRRRNFLKDGDTTATGQVVRDGVDMGELMDETLAAIGYHEKRQRFPRENSGPVKRGVGMAAFFHGSGFTGGGEKKLASVAGIEGTAEGKVRVLAASTEIGQGTNTIFSQIVADTLGLPYEMIEVAQPDTDNVPNSGPTVASRTCMVVGKLIETAAISLKQTLVQEGGLDEAYTPEQFAAACQGYVKAHGQLRRYSQYQQPANIRWSDETYQGDAYAAYGWAIYAAEVSVDTRTFETRVDDFVAMQEIGRIVNPIMAEGQVQGGVAQGIGYALYENVVYHEGQVKNNQMTNYIMPTAADLPVIRVLFHEVPYAGGPRGAKGVGELPIDGPAPAILSAVENAVGVSVTHIPATPEVLMKEMVVHV